MRFFMKSRFFNFLLLVTSLLGYLEWSGNNHTFLFQAEIEILSKLYTNPSAVFHPFIIIPLLGQSILLVTLFQKTPNKTLTFLGIGAIGILLVFMIVIGMLALNYKIIISTIPFISMVFFTIKYHRKTTTKIN
jgi:hypothetical protein